MKRIGYWSFRRVVENIERVVLMNFISTYRNLPKAFSFLDFLMIENNEQSAHRKDPVIALFVEQVKTYFENV